MARLFPPPLERLLKVSEDSEILGVAERTARTWIAAGRLPVVRLSMQCVRVDQEGLRRFRETEEVIGEIDKRNPNQGSRCNPPKR